MKPVFESLEGVLSERIRMLKQLRMKAFHQEQYEVFKLNIQLFEAYRSLPLGLNPSSRQQFKIELKECQSVSDLALLTKKLRLYSQRYSWNQSLCRLLSSNEFWSSQTTSWKFKQQDWKQLSPYAYYSSEDLRFLSERVFPAIEAYSRSSLNEVKRVYTKKNAAYSEHLGMFRNYLQSLQVQLNNERHQMVQAMLARLELLARSHHLHNDDVLFYVSEQLGRQGIDWRQTLVGARPCQTSMEGFGATEFHYFHQFIALYGNDQQKKRCDALPWVASGEYVYHKKQRQWNINSTLLPGVSIPSSKRSPAWLFRGRNARYDAFHDLTRTLTARYALEHAERVKDVAQRTLTLSYQEKAAQRLRNDFLWMQQEIARINKLHSSLIPVIHSKTRDALKRHQQNLYQKSETLVLAQLALIKNGQETLATIIDQNEQLDGLLALSRELSDEVSQFPKGYRLSGVKTAAPVLQDIVEQECYALKNEIMKHKIKIFVLGLQNKKFDRVIVYDSIKRPIYCLPRSESVADHCNSLKRYLSPKQQSALLQLQGVLQGEFKKDNRCITYAELKEAASQLVDDPDDILRPIFQRFIIPSIIATDTVGYQLLLDYERYRSDATHKRSEVLKALQQEEKISLYSMLKRAFVIKPNLQKVSKIKMNSEILSVEAFGLRLSQLEPEAILDVVKPYMKTYRGDEEHLWPIFSYLSAGMAVAYGHQRLALLLRKEDYLGLANSACLAVLEVYLKEDKSAQKTLLSFLQTVTLDEKNLTNIDRIVERFADQQQTNLWVQRREFYLLQRLNAMILNPTDSEKDASLKQYLVDHPDWLTSEPGKIQMATVLRSMRMKDWSKEQHALVNTISDPTIREAYQVRLLKHVLLDSNFAEIHLEHLPSENDTLGRFELFGAAEFRAVCESAIRHFRSQKQIDNINAIRLLESLLSDGLTMVFDLEDLHKEFTHLLVQFKEQLRVDVLAKEVMLLIDSGDHEKARVKIKRLSETYQYYRSIQNKSEMQKAVEALTRIAGAIEERIKLKQLLPDEGLAFIEFMPVMDSVEPFRKRLQHSYENKDNATLNHQLDFSVHPEIEEVLSEESIKTAPITINTNTEIARKIIVDMQTSETMEASIQLMQTILSSQDLGCINEVLTDLLSYFREAYRISTGFNDPEEHLKIHARIQLERMQYLVDTVQIDSSCVLAIFAQQHDRIANQLLAMTMSLKAIVENQQRELPELNHLIVLCIEFELIDPDLKAQWIRYLKEILLPYIEQHSSQVSIQLAAVLPSLLRVLEGNELPDDRERLNAYEQYHHDVVQSSVKNTSKIRLLSSTSSHSSSHSAVTRCERNTEKRDYRS